MEEGKPLPGPHPDSSEDADAHKTDPSTAIVLFENRSTAYIVQVPKDQIFRVPPPENARIVEEHRNKTKDQKRGSACCSRLLLLFATLLVIAILGVVGVFIFYFLATPDVPHFSVDHIAEVDSSSRKPAFVIIMRAQNPSATMDLYSQDGGIVDLFHKGRRTASGEPPDFRIGHKTITEIKVSLRGGKAALHKELASSKGSNDVIPLSLEADFPVKLGLGALSFC